MEAKKNLLDAFSNIKLEPKKHVYTLDDGSTLPSVSKELKEFINPFDAEKISFFSAQKWNRENPDNPKTPEEIQAEWKANADEAIALGTAVHEYAERYPILPEPQKTQERGVYQFFEELDPRYVVIAQELSMYSPTYQIAGTADMLLYDTQTDTLVINDWKTNGDLYKNYRGQKLKEPFKDLVDCPFNKYCIQQSWYKAIIEDATNLKVSEMWITWLPHNELENGVCYRIKKVIDLSERITEWKTASTDMGYLEDWEISI